MIANRREAGRLLATRLAELNLEAPVILALPRGGVPVAAEVAAALGAPLDLLLVRKLGVPSEPELAAAAAVDLGRLIVVRHEPVLRAYGLDEGWLARAAAQAADLLARRRSAWLAGRPAPDLGGATAVIVDDGIATGTTARAAIDAVRAAGAGRIILAPAVVPREVAPALAAACDRLVCLEQPARFFAVGQFYDDFGEVTDADVAALLHERGARP